MCCLASDTIMSESVSLTLHDGSPLPPSLATLRLESGYPIDLEELAEGEFQLSAAAAPTLTVCSADIRCSLGWMCGVEEPQAVDDTGPALHGHRIVSRLPAGFGALEMHTQCITSEGSGEVQQDVTPTAAALMLFMGFAAAPASYRHFRLHWPEQPPLYVHLSGPLDPAEPSCTALAGQGRVAFDTIDVLAEHLQEWAAMLSMSVAVHAALTRHIVISRYDPVAPYCVGSLQSPW